MLTWMFFQSHAKIQLYGSTRLYMKMYICTLTRFYVMQNAAKDTIIFQTIL